MLKQLMTQNLERWEPLKILYDEHHNGVRKPKFEKMVDVSRATLARSSPTFIVIDAFGECSGEEKSQLLPNVLRSMQSVFDLRLLTTSRELPKFERYFADDPTLSVAATPDDIDTYVTNPLDRLPNCVGRDQDLRRLVQLSIS